MAILGGHILKRAMAVVGSQTIGFMKFTERATNAQGVDVPVYSNAVLVAAQVQAVPHSAFQYLGLDYNKDYVRVYTETYVNDLQRDKEADRFAYCGIVYELLTAENWKRPQGFTGVLAVRIK